MVRSMPYHLHASNAQFQFAVWAACQWGFNGSPTDNAGLGTTIQLNSKQSKHIQGQGLIARALPPITYRFHQPPARTCRGTGDPHRVGQPGLYLRAIMRHRLWGDDFEIFMRRLWLGTLVRMGERGDSELQNTNCLLTHNPSIAVEIVCFGLDTHHHSLASSLPHPELGDKPRRPDA
jgi:hypothetical protein